MKNKVEPISSSTRNKKKQLGSGYEDGFGGMDVIGVHLAFPSPSFHKEEADYEADSVSRESGTGSIQPSS